MFTLAELKSVVRINPSQLGESIESSIIDQLNYKLTDKVIFNVGLFVRVFDVTDISAGHILPGDGASHHRVNFRALMFRPCIGEIVYGHVLRSSIAGTYVRVGQVFQDIFIPAKAHQHGSEYNEAEKTWVWKYCTEEVDSGDEDNNIDVEPEADSCVSLFMDVGEPIRFRVVDEVFEEQPPEQENKESCPPYTIIGSINEPGLGMLSWWLQTAEQDKTMEG
ncbi:hypothetical protein GJ496_001503 [Pomphorhynchus laevis]|nr:hypothetical protein GJ496_001503 [Pomphorhynchus laevis]